MILGGQRLALAFFSISSFFLTAYEPRTLFFSALMISSARHSAMVLKALKDFLLAPMASRQMAWDTLRMGETSTACLRTTPPEPILVASSLAPQFMMAPTSTAMGFLPVSRWMISKAWRTMRMALTFLPVFLPWYWRQPTSLSTTGMTAFLKRLAWYRPAVWGRQTWALSERAMQSLKQMSSTVTSSQAHFPNSLAPSTQPSINKSLNNLQPGPATQTRPSHSNPSPAVPCA